MKKIWILFILFLVGCSPASLPTPTLVPATSTKISNPTLIPTLTPHPPLQTDGPYLLFQNDVQILLMIDADGTGRKYIELPQNAYIPDLGNAVSPNGEWLAYFTGSAGEPHDLSLNLLNLVNETAFLVAKLIAKGFPENLEPVTVTTEISEYDDCFDNMSCKISIVEMAFMSGIRTLDWSYNSQHLGFAAQIDGPSSDIYIYNVTDKSINRITNDLENVNRLEWSPSGNQILYESSKPGRIYTYRKLNIINFEGKEITITKLILIESFWRGEGWIGNNLYLISSGGEGAPSHNFQYINTDTQQIKQLWKYGAEYYTININQEEFLVLTFPEGIVNLQPEPEKGIYIANFDGRYIKITDEPYVPVAEGPSNTYFVLQSRDYINVIFPLLNLSTDGEIIDLYRKINLSYPPITSPDDNWAVVTDENGTYLYSAQLELIKSWDAPYSITIWRPDSTGFFLQSNGTLYYVSMNDKELNLIDVCPTQDCSFRDYVWLP